MDDELLIWIAESVDVVMGPHGGENLVPDSSLRSLAHEMRVRSMLEISSRAFSRGDLDVAQTWLERALRVGIPPEAESTAGQVLDGLEKKKCDLTAVWVAMAESGDSNAMYNAGLCFWRKEQLEEAEHWWRKGAEVGDVECQTKVGVVQFRTGNLQEAERWFRRAAEHHEPVAIFNLGVLAYERGAIDEAVTWFRRAREVGHEGATQMLQQLRGDDDA